MSAAPAKTRNDNPASPIHIGHEVTMGEILHAYPTAKTALFIRYHIGGCTSCSYQLTDTLAEVHQNFRIQNSLDEMLDAVRQSAAIEAKIHISQQELVAVLSHGEEVRLLDARSPDEWKAAHLADAQPRHSRVNLQRARFMVQGNAHHLLLERQRTKPRQGRLLSSLRLHQRPQSRRRNSRMDRQDRIVLTSINKYVT